MTETAAASKHFICPKQSKASKSKGQEQVHGLIDKKHPQVGGKNRGDHPIHIKVRGSQ